MSLLLLASLLLLFTPFLMASLRLCYGWHFCGCDNFDGASVARRFWRRFCCFLVALVILLLRASLLPLGITLFLCMLFLALLFGFPFSDFFCCYSEFVPHLAVELPPSINQLRRPS
jgi:hypothetical protein